MGLEQGRSLMVLPAEVGLPQEPTYTVVPKFEEMGLAALKDTSGKKGLVFQWPGEAAKVLIANLAGTTNRNGLNFLFFGAWQWHKPGVTTPIGHLCFRLKEEFGRPIASCNTFLPTLVKPEIRNAWPVHFQQIIHSSGIYAFTGLMINREFEGKKFGSFLWSLGVGTLEILGFPIYTVFRDTTKSSVHERTERLRHSRPNSYQASRISFYESLGAVYTRTIDKGLGPTQERVGLTRPTPIQEAIIARFPLMGEVAL